MTAGDPADRPSLVTLSTGRDAASRSNDAGLVNETPAQPENRYSKSTAGPQWSSRLHPEFKWKTGERALVRRFPRVLAGIGAKIMFRSALPLMYAPARRRNGYATISLTTSSALTTSNSSTWALAVPRFFRQSVHGVMAVGIAGQAVDISIP